MELVWALECVCCGASVGIGVCMCCGAIVGIWSVYVLWSYCGHMECVMELVWACGVCCGASVGIWSVLWN